LLVSVGVPARLPNVIYIFGTTLAGQAG
jgi:hypothetical protein